MLIADLTRLCDELIRKGDAAAAVAACDQALSGKLSRPLTAQVLSLKAKSLVAQDGKWEGPAVACLKDALALTKPNSPERGRVLVAITAAYGTMACPFLCRRYRDEFIELLRSTRAAQPLEVYRPAVEFNLAVAYHEIDNLPEAEDAYYTAKTLCSRSDVPATRSWVHLIAHNLVDIYLELGCDEDAKNLMDTSYPYLPDAEFGAQMRNRRAIYALHVGDLDAAVLWAESGLGHPSCDNRTRAALTFTKAQILCASGQRGLGRDLAVDARRMANDAHSNRLCQRISRFINQVSRGE